MTNEDLASMVTDIDRRLRALEIRFYALAALMLSGNLAAILVT